MQSAASGHSWAQRIWKRAFETGQSVTLEDQNTSRLGGDRRGLGFAAPFLDDVAVDGRERHQIDWEHTFS